jgi:FixJ family two-component response regulator
MASAPSRESNVNEIRDRVYVVDDDQVAAQSVAALVREMGVRVDTFASAEDFLAAYDGHRPGCLVTDVRMLRMSGLELQEKLRAQGCHLAVVVLTAYAETSVTIRALQGGAFTLLEKPCRDFELWDAIRAALLDDARRWEAESQQRQIRQRLASLTTAEHDVLKLIVEGQINKQIAHPLEVSVRTIEVRRSSIYAKLRVDSLAELIRLVVLAEQELR